MTDLTNPIFHDEDAARAHFEGIRWPHGPTCPHCGVIDEATRVQGKSHRKGMYQCNACREPFTVTVGTVMESSHVSLCKWALAFHLFAASKKGYSAHQLHRTLGVTYKTAWFMAHRIREAMTDTKSGPIGGEGKTIEVDETFLGSKKTYTPGKGVHKKSGSHGARHTVLTFIERDGRAKSVRLDALKSHDIELAFIDNANEKSTLMTDEANHYKLIGKDFASHQTVNHSRKEYARGAATTNTVEGFFSIFKRGMKGVYQHCSEQHLHRYLAEFDFRYSNRIALEIDDYMRAERAIKGAEGKRLTYHQPR
ncbi:MAG TPA: IS1595 family transposase [Magnetospirillaceae bacterium]|jgi:transposase-like protein